MKKALSMLLASTMLFSVALTGCGSSSTTTDKTKVGMATDSGTIDDKSFNQGTWEGIKRYSEEKGTIAEKYLQPDGEQHDNYVNAITDLVETGHNIIVTPGFKFETAVNETADTFKDAKFILIDGQPHEKDSFEFVKHDNVVSVFFEEQEAGFLAGIAAAKSTKTGKLGFIGGMEIPPVQKFGWGYRAGVVYANENFGTNAEVVDYIYQGTFNETAAGQTLAAGMYDKGIDIIFACAGGVGVGVINEAKERATNGQDVYVVGVDVDQYDSGLLNDSEKSIILTSAVKGIAGATYNYIDAILNDTFPGGEVIRLSLKEDGVGLPAENPNLSKDALEAVEQGKKAVLDGKFTVPKALEEVEALEAK